jgi:HD-GYP domain-containing protein (c-di-GMP phosphodiesterase class II)
MICAASQQALKSMFQDARMGNAVDPASVDQLVRDISDSVNRNSDALISLARLKTVDDYTYMHSVAVCALMIALARQLRLNESDIRAIGIAGLLHDMGKALIPVSVLNKPGKLSQDEFLSVKRHPELGHALQSRSPNVGRIALDVCLHHHERIDGSGYPFGLSGSEISLYAKMGAVCDVYDAITSVRPYKAGWDPAESMRQMGLWAAAGHFDKRVFHAFVKSIGIYPVGALVRLGSGLLGIVTEQNKTVITRPRVMCIYSTKLGRRIESQSVDLGCPGCNDKIVAREDPEKWKFSDLNELWGEQA